MDVQDVHIVQALAQNVDAQFEDLVRAYQDRLYGFALLRLHDRHVAEEIVILALERAYYALKGYSAQRILELKLSAWLLEITRNACYNYIRDTNTRNTYLPVDSIDVLPETNPIRLIPDTSSSPEDIVTQLEHRDEIIACISQLPHQYQSIIRLYYLEHQTGPEIAEQLHLPLGTVKSHIHRGTKQLQLLLNNSMKEAL